MKTLKFLGENIIISLFGTVLSFVLSFYEKPLGRIMEAIQMQMVRNFIIIFICFSVGRLLVSCIQKKMMKWDRKKTEKYEKLTVPAMYTSLVLVIYILLESLGPNMY